MRVRATSYDYLGALKTRFTRNRFSLKATTHVKHMFDTNEGLTKLTLLSQTQPLRLPVKSKGAGASKPQSRVSRSGIL